MVTLAMSELAFIVEATSSSLGWLGPSFALLKPNSSLADSVYFFITGAGGGGTGAGGGGGGGVVTVVVSCVVVVVATGTGAGAGAARDHFGDVNNGAYKKTAPYLNAGLGFQYKFTPTLGMQADIREVGTLYRTRVPQPLDFKHTFNTYANVGLTWAFGAAPAPAPAPIVTPPPAPAPAPAMAPPPPPPAPVPPPPPAPVMKKFTLSASELFGFNSAKLGPNQPKLDEVASTMNANSDISSVTIVGYTDRLGSKAYNQKLSEQRANSVKAYLESKGVAASRLTAVGKGEADPVVECKTEKKHADLVKCLEPNRRVEIEPVTFTKQVN